MIPTRGWFDHWSDGATTLSKHPHEVMLNGQPHVLGTTGTALCIVPVDEFLSDVPAAPDEFVQPILATLAWPDKHAHTDLHTTRAALRDWRVPENGEGKMYGSIEGVAVDVDLLHFALGHLRHGDVRVRAFAGSSMRDIGRGTRAEMQERGVAVYGDGWTVIVAGLRADVPATGDFPVEAAQVSA